MIDEKFIAVRTLALAGLILAMAVTTTGCGGSDGDDDGGAEPAAETASGEADPVGDAGDTGEVHFGGDAADEATRTADGAAAQDNEGGAGDGTASGDVVATVDGVPLAMADFQRQAFDTQRYFVERGLDPNSEDGQRELLALRRQVLLDMINQTLIETAATQMGIDVTREEAEASIEGYRESVGDEGAFEESIANAGTTLEEVIEMERRQLIGQRFVDRITEDVPESATFVRARHILCEAEADCDVALTRLRSGEDFAAVAADVSVDEITAENGGDLDWIPAIDGVEYLPSSTMEAAIRALRPGEISGVISTEFGYHIIEVTETDPSRPLTEELRFQLRDKKVQEWLAEQRRQADIEVFIDDLKDIVEPR